MMGISNYLGFIVAGIILNLTPGADTMYILTRSISQGRKAGVYSVLGISSGALIHTAFASLGLSIILAKSAIAYIQMTFAIVTISLSVTEPEKVKQSIRKWKTGKQKGWLKHT